MGRKLIFCLYVQDDIETNYAYEINKRCLKRYIHVFDKAKFIISVDDINNKEMISKGISWIFDVVKDLEVEIRVAKNTFLCESKFLKEEVVDKLDTLNDLVYFGHAKGVTNFKFNFYNRNLKSIALWICGLYYFNFSRMNEVEYALYGLLDKPEMFYGAFLLREKQPKTLSGYFYAGTHYWLNPMEIYNNVRLGKVKIPEVNNRYYAENFPTNVCSKFENVGDGLCTPNYKFIHYESMDFYNALDYEWVLLSKIYNDKGFIDFSNEMIGDIFGEVEQ